MSLHAFVNSFWILGLACWKLRPQDKMRVLKVQSYFLRYRSKARKFLTLYLNSAAASVLIPSWSCYSTLVDVSVYQTSFLPKSKAHFRTGRSTAHLCLHFTSHPWSDHAFFAIFEIMRRSLSPRAEYYEFEFLIRFRRLLQGVGSFFLSPLPIFTPVLLAHTNRWIYCTKPI